MRDWLVLMAHLIVTSIRITAPGGARTVITESLLLKHQLLILSRSRKKAPNLRSLDRVLLDLGAMLVSPQRMLKVAVAITPATLLRFHCSGLFHTPIAAQSGIRHGQAESDVSNGPGQHDSSQGRKRPSNQNFFLTCTEYSRGGASSPYSEPELASRSKLDTK